ncbi:MAG: tetratricopeptide repeat protein [Bacteroidetes bacterium]|nr:tetratricopeptide repeat protein [Bacteroidota bacterium]
MKIIARIFLLIFFSVLTGTLLFSQNKTLDSLKLLLKNETKDTTEVNVLNSISKELSTTGDYDRARNYAEQAKILADRLHFQRGVADYYSNIGVVFYYQGNYSEALNSHLAALKIRDSLQDKRGIAASYNNISVVYIYQKNYSDALHYLLPSLAIKEELGDKKGLISTCNNIGLAYYGLKNFSEALKYYQKSLAISVGMKSAKGMGNAYNNIGDIYYDEESFDTAYHYYNEAMTIRRRSGYRQGMMSSLVKLGNTCTLLKNFKEAHADLDSALAIAIDIKEKEGMGDSYDALSRLAAAEGDFKSAFEYLGKFKDIKDSIFNEQSVNNSIRASLNYEFGKKSAAQKAENEKNEALLKEEANRKQLAVYFVLGILLLVVVFSFFVYRGFLQKKSANRELDLRNRKIEQAYTIIETKNQEITDSINYAQRIQQAILPEISEIKNALPESFVFYQPKDIVGGDFYFFTKKENEVFIAAADCTGHGVPGAFMSLIGSKELGLANLESNSPGKILQRLNLGLKNTLKQNNLEGTKDGMDIALVKITGKEIIFSGANRPLWIVRKNATTTEEIKPVKTAIAGFTPDDQEFAEHTLQMNSGDTFYIFTDGYTDQFGNSNTAMRDQKKLSTKKFREKLLSIQQMKMEEQENELRKFIGSWRGENEQLDDILVIGVRV